MPLYLRRRDFAISPQSCLSQFVRLGVIFPAHVGNGECQRPRQLPAGPVEGIEAWTAADILPGHLPNNDLRVRVNVEFSGLKPDRVLQRFHQGCILSNIVVLVTDPFGDADGTIRHALDHNPNTRRPRISQASAVYIGNQFGHHFRCTLYYLQDACIQLLRQDDYLVPFRLFQ